MKNLLFTILMFCLLFSTSCISEKQLFVEDLRSEIPFDKEGKMNIDVYHKRNTIIFELEPVNTPYTSSSLQIFSLFTDQAMLDKIEIGQKSVLYHAKNYFKQYEIRIKYTNKLVSTGVKDLHFEED
ncbi:hypothetical protein [Flammeovirga sp. SubArs3]|uniref:hypothetical protein n=1 Tax=Flammeovirga sp. SubArs3 TaxID=2995316 RepID=UPI00248B64CD|nr:hypothetical protein [Flammeovirga sp. SubArs3]